MGQVITFYSYKGGTGRSMALANTACLLARSLSSGEAVLAIDWDLEAPGLHRFFVRGEGDSPQAAGEQPGVIDLVLELQGLIEAKESLREDSDAVADLVASVDFDRFITPTQVPNVRLMAAGAFDDEYENRVVAFNWPAFYEKAPAALPALVDFLSTRYAYVLIDSRTGLSDLTGVCTMMLPEKLVTVFTPSRQSLDGLVGVVRRALTYRRQAPDLRPLAVFPLPSRIELAEPDLRESWRLGGSEGLIGYQALFESLFRELYELPECSLQNYFDDVQIQHVPRYAYGEQIAVLIEKEADRLSLTRSYQAFVSRLENLTVPWDTATPAIEGLVHPPPAYDEAERSYLEAADLYAEVGDIHSQAKALAALAGYQLRRGLKGEADRTIGRARGLVPGLGSESGPALLIELGDIVLAADTAKAAAIYEDAFQIAPLNSALEAEALQRQGEASFMVSQFSRALHYYNEAVQRFRHSNEGHLRILDLQPRIAKANLEVGRYETAEAVLGTILQAASASGDELGTADALVDLALAKLGRGDVGAAFDSVIRATEIFERLGRSKPDLWLAHARIVAERGDFDQADTLIDRAIQEYRRAGDKRRTATALRYAGDFRANRKRTKIS